MFGTMRSAILFGVLLTFGCGSTKSEPATVVQVNPAPTGALSQRGETCVASTSCAAGLICVPIQTGAGAIGLGRCDVANYNLTPTGKSCWAECKQPIDCCELPISEMAPILENGITYTPRSCADIAKQIGSNPSGCDLPATTPNPKSCFLYKTYCDCSQTNPWSCTNARCQYTQTCAKDGYQPRGCPSFTRTEAPTTATCNTTTNTCTAVAAPSGCASDAECVNKSVTSDPLGLSSDTCAPGECVCLSPSCYRRCNGDLDCEHGYTCDSRKVCVPTGSCDTDAYCTTFLQDITAKCVSKTCKVPCLIDQNCNGSGVGTSKNFFGRVCSKGYCEDLGCSSDLECSTEDRIKLFCLEPPASTSTDIVHSAITD